jgi:hypothetical protein
MDPPRITSAPSRIAFSTRRGTSSSEARLWQARSRLRNGRKSNRFRIMLGKATTAMAGRSERASLFALASACTISVLVRWISTTGS